MQNNIGDARREYAAKYGKFTQEDAAMYFGVSTSTYKKWEQGQGMLNGEQLRALAQKYETTVDYLLDRSVNYAIVELPEELAIRDLLSRVRSAELEEPAHELGIAHVVREKHVVCDGRLDD